MKYFIGADLGTSALKLLLCEQNGKIVSSVTRAYKVDYPHPGWCEQNPLDWWEAFVDGVKALTVGVDTTKIVGIGVAGQMHGLVLTDEKNTVIRPAILWNDGRSDRETRYLNAEVGKEALLSHTANIAFAGFTAPKLLWVKNNEPEHFAGFCKLMLPKDYINYRLTGVHACDYSDASGMLLLDVKNKCWSKEMLAICGLTERQMPKLFESGDPIGTLLPDVAWALGLPPQTVVAAGAGDNAAAAVGTGTVGNGRCNISLGTSGTVFVSSERFVCDPQGALHSFCHADGQYHVMGCILSAASCNQWFYERVLRTDDYEGVQAEIAEEALGNNGVYFLPYLMGERSPINDTDATGVFLGLRPNTAAKDMVLAILEGVSFAIRENLEMIERMGIPFEAVTVCGGGSRSALWMKILANVLGLELSVLESEEGPALGAAYLAAMAVGEYKGFHELPACKIKERIGPDHVLSARYEKKYRRFQKIYPHLKNLYQEIKE